jgi:hypothetical protein
MSVLPLVTLLCLLKESLNLASFEPRSRSCSGWREFPVRHLTAYIVFDKDKRRSEKNDIGDYYHEKIDTKLLESDVLVSAVD